MYKRALTTLIYLIISLFFLQQAVAAVQPLPVDQAFRFSSYVSQNKQLVMQWEIAPGYYIYRDRLHFMPMAGQTANSQHIVLPPGQIKMDGMHREHRVYFDALTLSYPLSTAIKNQLAFDVTYQGCSSQGFCYAPVKKKLNIDLVQNQVTVVGAATPMEMQSQQNTLTQLLAAHHLFIIIPTFLMLGLLLAFTPCVLPMVPILSSIIVGHGVHANKRKAFGLSLAYVLGMALTYALAGVLVALMGNSVQVALQQPGVIIVCSVIFLLLALSLFGFYDIKLPNALHNWIVARSHRQKGGTYFSVFLMGGFSTLIVSPCVSAPLVGALAYIGNSGDVVLGGVALLALGIGMGIPLLLIGASAGALLPKAGAWMDRIKQLFGLLMIGLAIWMLGRVLSATTMIYLWAIFAMTAAVFIWQLQHSKKIWHKLHQGLGLMLLSYGFILIGGALSGKTDLFYFLGGPVSPLAATEKFSLIKNMTELDQQLAVAKSQKRPVLLDFYADWCTSCVTMDHRVFNQAAVQTALEKFVLLRADVTQNNAFDRALLKRFKVVAPPTIVLFDKDGKLLAEQQIVGEVNSKEFLAGISQLRYDRELKFCESHARTC